MAKWPGVTELLVMRTSLHWSLYPCSQHRLSTQDHKQTLEWMPTALIQPSKAEAANLGKLGSDCQWLLGCDLKGQIREKRGQPRTHTVCLVNTLTEEFLQVFHRALQGTDIALAINGHYKKREPHQL